MYYYFLITNKVFKKNDFYRIRKSFSSLFLPLFHTSGVSYSYLSPSPIFIPNRVFTNNPLLFVLCSRLPSIFISPTFLTAYICYFFSQHVSKIFLTTLSLSSSRQCLLFLNFLFYIHS